MTHAHIAIAPFLALGLVCAPAAAEQPEGSEITVRSSAVEDWAERISHDLDRKLEADVASKFSKGRNSGIVRVRFTIDEAGKPQNVVLYDGVSNWRINRHAMMAVSHLDTVHPMPGAIAPHTIFQANIIYAESSAGMDRLVRKLAREERSRIDRSPREERIFVFGSTVRRVL